MDSAAKKAVLLVSFGTSYAPTRKVTLDAIERDIALAFPDAAMYKAWTSKIIIAKLKKQEGVCISTVKEAMEQMASDGITDVVVQPTHIINGIENDTMKEEILTYSGQFRSISFGAPLLTSEEDSTAVIRAVAEEFPEMNPNTVLVLMGHGTTHYANSIYAALDYKFKDLGYSNIFLGTVEAYPSVETLMRLVRAYGPKKVILAPFMIVAGDHARNDMAGEDEDSWTYKFRQEGYEVTPVFKGLGEYTGIRSLFIRHAKEADESRLIPE